jgi:hypothetical protein
MPKLVDGGTKSRHYKSNAKKDAEKQAYDEIESINVTADFSLYKGTGRYSSENNPNQFNADEKLSMLQSCLDWLKDTDDGRAVLHILNITSYLDITYNTWYNWGKRDERIKDMQDKILELIGSRVFTEGARSKINPVVSIFGAKNILPEMFKDRHEVEQTNVYKIDKIQISTGTNKQIEENKPLQIEEDAQRTDE